MMWCDNQMLDKENKVMCLAHLADGRVFDCPYRSYNERINAEHPCSDYRDPHERFQKEDRGM